MRQPACEHKPDLYRGARVRGFVSVCVSFQTYTWRRLDPSGTNFATHMHTNLERVVSQIKKQPCVIYRHIQSNVYAYRALWGLGGQQFRLLEKVPNGMTDWHHIWHTCSDLSGNGLKQNKTVTPDHRGHLYYCMAPNLAHICGFIWEWMYVKNNQPSIVQGAFVGVLGGHTFQRLGNLSNGQTDWDQMWHTSEASFGNKHMLKQPNVYGQNSAFQST